MSDQLIQLTAIGRRIAAIMHDSSSDPGHHRIRRAGWGGLTGVLSRGTFIGVNLISVPLTVDYLGAERYGVWLTISSIITWLVISDIGFGSSLINTLAEANGKDDDSLAQGLFATAFWALVLIAIFMAAVGMILLPLLDWHAILNIPGDASYFPEIRLSIALALLSFCGSIPSGLVISVYNAYQQVEKGNYWSMAASAASLFSLLIAVRFKGGIPLLVLALMSTVSLMRLINLFVLLAFEKPFLKPFPRFVQRRHFQRLWQLGRYYLFQQIGNIGMFSLHPILIAQFSGPIAVGPFNVAYKLFTLPQQILILFLVPLVGAYGEARVNGESRWILKTVFGSIGASFVFMLIVSCTLAAFHERMVGWWVGSSMLSDTNTVYWLGLYAVASGIATPLAIFLQGFERAREIALFTIANGLLMVLAAVYLIPWSGSAGMAAAMALSYAIVNCGCQVIIASNMFRDLTARDVPERST